MKWALGAYPFFATLVACSANYPALYEPNLSVKQVNIGGQLFLLSPLTAATWIASEVPAISMITTEKDDSTREALVNAIEKASGCRVTDSDYSGGGRQFDAQVDCPFTPLK